MPRLVVSRGVAVGDRDLTPFIVGLPCNRCDERTFRGTFSRSLRGRVKHDIGSSRLRRFVLQCILTCPAICIICSKGAGHCSVGGRCAICINRAGSVQRHAFRRLRESTGRHRS